MSETELGRRFGNKKGIPKNADPSMDSGSKEVRDKGKYALGESREGEGEAHSEASKKREKAQSRASKKKGFYPVRELEALEPGSSETDEFSPSEEEDLEAEAAHYGEERQANNLGNQTRAKGGNHATSWPTGPSPPLPYSNGSCSDSFLTREEQKKIQQAFPVFEAANGGRVHAPVEYIQIKELAESVRNYGVNANFTVSQVERLATLAMTPGDWQTTVKAALPSMGHYMEWKALWYEAAQAQAKVNATTEGNQRQWTFELLTGQGQYANDQTNYDWGAYTQVSDAAIKAWKALSKRGDSGGHLTKIIQGPQESFSDFVARMTDAAGRIFGDPEQAMPLIEQLVFEQATQECRTAITPRKNKGLQEWLRICRELGGPLTNAGLAAAILQGRKYSGAGDQRVCYNCGKPGHIKRDCRALTRKKVPGLCTRCGKGNHWSNECRSVRDIKGRILQQGSPQMKESEEVPKNGYPGPKSQGPQKYGTRAHKWTLQAAEPPQAQQGWTSAPPPNSY